jgi:hypothetical protein
MKNQTSFTAIQKYEDAQVLSTHFCPEAATVLGFRFLRRTNIVLVLRLPAAQSGKRTMFGGKGGVAAASASADRDALSGRPSSVRNRALCRRGIAMPRRPKGLDGFLPERSNSTSMCTQSSFHLSKSRCTP